MTIRTPKQALAVADGTRVNIEGTCQRMTRGYYNAPSAGDVDGDGDADAYDGWLSEPKAAKHVGDRNPPAGYPASFRSNDPSKHGHRAITRGAGIIRSTDFDGVTKRYRAGVLGNGTIAEIERAMNVTYLGWSETIDGHPIPKDPTPPEEKPTAAGKVPSYLDLTVALSRLADASKSAGARRLYLSARSVIGPLVSSSDRVSVPNTVQGVSAALKAKRAASTGAATKARLTAAITLLAPLV